MPDLFGEETPHDKIYFGNVKKVSTGSVFHGAEGSSCISYNSGSISNESEE